MKKKTVWIIVGILLAFLGYRVYTNYQESLKEGHFIVPGGSIPLSYDMIPTYTKRIEASEHFSLIDHEQHEHEDVLIIGYNALPYARGNITVHIPKDVGMLTEPIAFYVIWFNLDYTEHAERLKAKEDPYLPFMGIIREIQPRCTFLPFIEFHVRGNTVEECKVHAENYVTKLVQIFAE